MHLTPFAWKWRCRRLVVINRSCVAPINGDFIQTKESTCLNVMNPLSEAYSFPLLDLSFVHQLIDGTPRASADATAAFGSRWCEEHPLYRVPNVTRPFIGSLVLVPYAGIISLARECITRSFPLTWSR